MGLVMNFVVISRMLYGGLGVALRVTTWGCGGREVAVDVETLVEELVGLVEDEHLDVAHAEHPSADNVVQASLRRCAASDCI
jgi:hypothetical protein